MFAYYLGIAIRSLKRNLVLTALMIVAVAVGIGASMTVFTVFRLMSGDPFPEKSSRLFAPQIDNWGPDDRDKAGEPGDQLSYRDAMALIQAHAAVRQTALYSTGFIVQPADPQQKPLRVHGRAAFADFFAMFDAPFKYGGPWSPSDDDNRADTIVLKSEMNDKLFAGANSVGKTLQLDGRSYRIAGVLAPWEPKPRGYDVSNDSFSEVEDIFVPFNTAIDHEFPVQGNNNCNANPQPGWLGHRDSECIWIQFWVELSSAADSSRYHEFLDHYAAEQQRIGRFKWPPLTKLRNLREWLVFEHVVPDDSRISVIIGFAFLGVCLINAIGLMLAKFSTRAGEIGVRRALGASRQAIFIQCLVETSVIGAAGGVIGLGLTLLGLAGVRATYEEDIGRVAHLDLTAVGLTLLAAILATTLAGLYPTWRASRIQPAWQLKAQ
jgi:putative ABC transport system permease protein